MAPPRRLILNRAGVALNALLWPAILYFFATVIVAVGLLVGARALSPQTPEAAGRDLLGRCINFDGDRYEGIADEGYSTLPGAPGKPAFFPAFPIAGRWLARATGLRTDGALTIVANVCLLVTFILLARYVRWRYPREPHESTDYTLLALGLLPTTFYFRMAYSESMFLLLTALTLFGIERRWQPVLVAAIVGLATATRPVGVALLPALALYVWHWSSGRGTQSANNDDSIGTATADKSAILARCLCPRVVATFKRVVLSAVFVALSLWGLVAYMAYQAIAFGNPLEFVESQHGHYNSRRPPISKLEKTWRLPTLEPIRAKYDPDNPDYWARHDVHALAPLSLQFANPIYFLFTAGLVGFGAWKGLLNRYEWLTALFLLLIPYVTRSHENAMACFGRFSAVALPAYFVMGWLLYRMGPTLSTALLAISGFFLGLYSALFAAGYRFI